ncbi:hypothetical protein TSUD_45970 [Trifolium subterraneum]|nr:hypothetical protein TSUD_45970 [Trifolium subterraneum]
MDSNNPYEIDDDDYEGLDWEAVVKAADAACQMQSEAKSNGNEAEKVYQKGKGKQSTLDNFVRISKKETETIQLKENDVEESTCTHLIDIEAAKTWIYPVNVPLRDYQFHITQTALFQNTMVALPTGLGKTLIAAVVMFNYFRWFPEGNEWAVDMTGQLSPPKRARLWKTKRVFFVTPQVLEKDIQSGKCLVKYLVCLVIDEAHRAMGNYSYCEAVRELMAVPVQLRILALTATPGSKQQTVQDVINNLHISKLEHRNETDHDVISYVHDRKIELIQVAMGQDAVEINNKFLEVIRPIVARLTKIGAIQNRDYRTLSPCVLLEMREKFRQGHLQDLSHINSGDVEGYFGVLITLYYIHKLLSSHGIRPAYEMLERKLKQGIFAKYMSKNEDILKARQLMQQSLSHGASSPKLSKMLEVLLEHFKTNDPQNSRVIIFSNYRESVRDIMVALGGTGDQVRATEFIGQSSGKTMKGQSQKVQQAVLKKFRSGAYNVIVATSIGEEGLDIMEVDLVISFDANISPLRMIQRMGRTGRKHDGRIPHVLKPEVQYVELSIEKFIPRQTNVIEDHLQISASKDRLTLDEIGLLEKYFPSTGENRCRLSLIAFPHFQTFPSRVHKVKHSYGSLMLIDTMQRLQGLPACPGDSENSSLQEGRCLGNSKSVVIIDLDEAKNDNELCSRDAMGRNVDSVNCLELDSGDMGKHQEETCDVSETIPETPDAKRTLSNEGANATETSNPIEQTSSLAIDACDNDMRDEELSPRLTNLIISGVVPESPIDERGQSKNRFVIRGCISPVHLQEEHDVPSLSCRETEKVIVDSGTGKNIRTSPVNETQTPLLELKNCAIRRGRVFVSQIEEGHIHNVDPSFSEESHPSCGERSVSIKPARKFKRLRKVEDTESNMNQKKNNIFYSTANFSKPSLASNPKRYKHCQGIRKPANVRDFIEEEAEVSSDASVSNDEDVEDGNSCDSFIDDRINATAASQPEASRIDMMAIYRRSLLSQTPISGGPKFSTTFSPDNVTMSASIGESGNLSGKTMSRFQTGQTSHSANRTSESVCLDQMTSETMPSTSFPTETDIRSRKRRLTFHHSGHFPSMNLEPEFALQSKKESVNGNATIDVLCDDQFYNDIDLDELEAQATSILKQKLDLSILKQDINPQSLEANLDVSTSPSFDLGI